MRVRVCVCVCVYVRVAVRAIKRACVQFCMCVYACAYMRVYLQMQKRANARACECECVRERYRVSALVKPYKGVCVRTWMRASAFDGVRMCVR